MLNAIHLHAKEKQHTHLILTDVKTAAEMTMCKEVAEGCMKRTCSQCSSEVLKEHFQTFIDIHGEQDIQYQTWGTRTIYHRRMARYPGLSLNLLSKKKYYVKITIKAKDVINELDHIHFT